MLAQLTITPCSSDSLQCIFIAISFHIGENEAVEGTWPRLDVGLLHLAKH